MNHVLVQSPQHSLQHPPSTSPPPTTEVLPPAKRQCTQVLQSYDNCIIQFTAMSDIHCIICILFHFAHNDNLDYPTPFQKYFVFKMK
jgi:hypothetical protein